MNYLPKWLTGDLVTRYSYEKKGTSRRGMIVSVRNATQTSDVRQTYWNFGQYVYYVFFQDGKLEGPFFQNELSEIR